jgi:GNAT superfamily N-acetyltransferase
VRDAGGTDDVDVVVRAATVADENQLLRLWALVTDPGDAGAEAWQPNARRWLARALRDEDSARFPLVEVDRAVVATAVATLDVGVPNPHCPRGRTVRLANVVTLPEHRGNGFATRLVDDVIAWARGIHADRIDLSASEQGQALYERRGFVLTTAPRMKLML